MSNVVLARVDDRFIHGQISVKWCRTNEIDFILVANDALANDKVRQGLMDMAVPQTVITRYCRVEDTLTVLQSLSVDKRVMLIVNSIADIVKIIELGVEIKLLNLGNISMSHGRKHVTSSVALNKEEFNLLKELKAQDITIEVRKLPKDDCQAIDLFKEEV